jgi:predicted transcriptional regulator
MTAHLKKSVTAHVSGTLAERLAQAAARQDRSNNWVMNQALELYLTIEEEQHARTLKALEDVKAGRVISHERMKVWAAGLGKPSQTRQKRGSKQ